METIDYKGRGLFLMPLKLTSDAPLIHRATVKAIVYPYRLSNALIFSWRGHGLAIGWWHRNPLVTTEEDSEINALVAALGSGKTEAINDPNGPQKARDTGRPWDWSDKISDADSIQPGTRQRWPGEDLHCGYWPTEDDDGHRQW